MLSSSSFVNYVKEGHGSLYKHKTRKKDESVRLSRECDQMFTELRI